jgi:glycosyltransferase involved in cell wall biosynthesis
MCLGMDMSLKVYMQPSSGSFGPKDESGIRRICEAMERYLPAFGVEFVGSPDEADVKVGHAGALATTCDVMMCAGLYWTAEMPHPAWELDANMNVISALRHADQVIVPSRWVANNIARDMRFYPHVIGHGVDINEWEPMQADFQYVLWAKNRASDVCDPTPVYELAKRFPQVGFVTTYYPAHCEVLHNVTITGQVPHPEMKSFMQGCAVYLSTTQETFGIATLEAMASGKPVLGYDWGGNKDLIQHGVNGYLAAPGNLEDLANGLDYCLRHRATLGENSRQIAQRYTWEEACRKMYHVFELASKPQEPTVTIVIPVFNYGDKVSRALDSALAQTYPVSIVAVNDGSTDNTKSVLDNYVSAHSITAYHIPNGGVANARNYGIERTETKYICCLDADDALEPTFIETLVPVLESDRSLGIAYTSLRAVTPDGRSSLSRWPAEFDPNQQQTGNNQIPTACLFRRKMWARLGGYQPRCCPSGAGFEDADLWMRAVEHGWGAKWATAEPLFIYSWLSGRVSSGDASDFHAHELEYYKYWYPWFNGNRLFASLAKPLKLSHPVRSYDQPGVSIVIPVAPHHITRACTALDSLEAQTYHNWEAIVVLDGPANLEKTMQLMEAYPYVKYVPLAEPRGAGYARNRGVEQASAPLLLFLDADDWLEPTCLFDMLSVYTETGHAIYTDYTGIADVDDVSRLEPKLQSRVISHVDGRATIRFKSFDYDCNQALAQPKDPPYIWCNITTLLPTSWHKEIGGFDEKMESWEDWLYWLKLAWAGKCFTRVAKPLMFYRFYTGTRRDAAHPQWQELMAYIGEQKGRSKTVGCKGCGGSRSAPVTSRVAPVQTRRVEMGNDGDYVMCQYTPVNTGDHMVSSVVPELLPSGNYGYHARGDRFLVHIQDVKAKPDLFIPEQIKLPARAASSTPSEPVSMRDIAVEEIVDPMARLAEVREMAKEAALRQFGKVEPGPVEEPKGTRKAKALEAEEEPKPKKRRVRRVVS